MSTRQHQLFEFGEVGDIADTFVLDMHLHVKFFCQGNEMPEGLQQIFHTVTVVGQITENSQVARAENLCRLEGLRENGVCSPVAQFKSELIALASCAFTRWAPFQERRAEAGDRESGSPHALGGARELIARERQHVSPVNDAQIDVANILCASEG